MVGLELPVEKLHEAELPVEKLHGLMGVLAPGLPSTMQDTSSLAPMTDARCLQV